MRITWPLSVALLLATTAASTVATEPAVEPAALARAVERTLASETVGIGVRVMIEVPAAGIEPVLILDAEGQVSFGEELEAWLEGEMVELGSFSFIVEGRDMYLRGMTVGGLLSPSEWLHVDLSAAPPGFGEMQASFEIGSDAALALYWLVGVDGAIEVLGREMVDGVEVTHIEVPIDLGLVRDQLPRWLLPAYGENLAGLRKANADVDRAEAWLDADGYITGITYDMPVSLGDQVGLAAVAYELSSFGEPIDLARPDPADIVDAWELVSAD